VLLLDYDGTLAPFRVNPAQAIPYPGVESALDELIAAGHTRVVIVSGRWTRDLLPLINLRQRPEIWGAHGWERLLPDGAHHLRQLPPAALTALVAADDWAEELEAIGGRTERKPASIAFHWRGLSGRQVAALRSEIGRRWLELGQPRELALLEFDGGMELRADGVHKGDVVQTLLQECGASTAMAYLGDDHTDEDAFRAMPRDGAAILVRETLRPTAAQLWLQPPHELLAFLRRWDEAARVHR
jgi:trehalose-phosphatase